MYTKWVLVPHPSHPKSSSMEVMGEEEGEGRINNVIVASDERKKETVFVQWHHVSGSWLMSVKLVSFRMPLIRSNESACRIRSSWT